MEQTKCNACGNVVEAGAEVVHHIVPEEAKKVFDISDSSTAMLCNACAREVSAWYRKKISSVTYDSNIKQFRAKSPTEMAIEYHSAYRSFVDFRGKRGKKIKKV